MFFLIRWLLLNYKAQKAETDQLIFEKTELELINTKLKTQVSKLRAYKQSTTTKDLKPTNQNLEIQISDKLHIIPKETIHYVTAEDNGTRIHKDDGTSIWTNNPVKHFESLLIECGFMRIPRSTIINTTYLTWVNHSTLKLVDGTELKIGRTYKKNLITRFS